MKRVLAVVFLLIILFAAWFLFFKTDKTSGNTASTKETSAAVKKHSDEFNQKIANMMNSYIEMKNAFVDADTAAIKLKTAQFISSTDSLNLTELQQKDSSLFISAQQNISDIKANAQPILKESDIQEMRHDFSMVSENLYPLLKTIGYEGNKLYWQNCPMAFGDDKPANWLSNTSEILNPYLGKNNPEYKSAMLHCGENMDSIYLK
jgi:Cu(I)/Ag(I) efflux system membrane fusion protein